MAHKTQLTILSLQKELRKEIEAITKDMLLKQPNSKDLIRLRAFSQNLPNSLNCFLSSTWNRLLPETMIPLPKGISRLNWVRCV